VSPRDASSYPARRLTIRTLLVGPTGHGGEEVYRRTVQENPPEGVEYSVSGDFHEGAPGAPCERLVEIALNRIVHPLTIPDIGMRALRLRERFDLLHVHAHPAHLRGKGDTPLVMSEGSSSAVYLGDYLGWSPERMRRGYRRSRRIYRALGIHDRLLTLERVSIAYVFSRWARDVNIRWGADPDKLEVVYPGFPVPEEVQRKPSEKFNFLFVGTDFERKGGFDVIEAFDRVASEREEAQLTLIADPWAEHPDRKIHSWVSPNRQQRLLDRLRALEREGRVDRRNAADRRTLMEELYPRADLFVMPSLAEGFGFTNVEAMSLGLPVITSGVGTMREIVDDGETGLVVPPGDVDRLTQAMLTAIAERQTTAAMATAARAAFLERFTIDRFRTDLGEIYRRALDS
jgi:glycosyltransferase involved in cell wall biosynthesis